MKKPRTVPPWKTAWRNVLLLCALVTAAAAMASPAMAEKFKVKIKTAQGDEIAVFSWKGAKILVHMRDDGRQQQLAGHETGSGKRKYHFLNSKDVFAKVKLKDNGFKIKDSGGKLLFKVKYKGDKIKISDNEQNRDPYVIKRKQDKLKVFRGGRELGTVVFKKARSRIKIKDAAGAQRYKINSDRLSPAYGVLLIPGISAIDRNILIAEMLLHDS